MPTELELTAMLKVLMSLPKEEAEKLVKAHCGEDESKSRPISYNSPKIRPHSDFPMSKIFETSVLISAAAIHVSDI